VTGPPCDAVNGGRGPLRRPISEQLLRSADAAGEPGERLDSAESGYGPSRKSARSPLRRRRLGAFHPRTKHHFRPLSVGS
jgi:hypothetical protein